MQWKRRLPGHASNQFIFRPIPLILNIYIQGTHFYTGAVRVRCLAQGHLDTPAGAGDRTSNLPLPKPGASRVNNAHNATAVLKGTILFSIPGLCVRTTLSLSLHDAPPASRTSESNQTTRRVVVVVWQTAARLSVRLRHKHLAINGRRHS